MSSVMRLSVIAVMLLAAAALGFIAMINNRPKPMQLADTAPPPVMVSYFVAAHPLPTGTLAREEDFTTRSAPPSSIPSAAILDTPEARMGLRGALVRAFLDTGAPITAADVLRPRDRGFLASVLDAGTRAVSMNVDAQSGVAGLIWPGDHVDVVLTQELEKANVAQRTISETILRDIRIIATDQEIVQGAAPHNEAAGKLARTVTLQLAPDQVERVTVALHVGKLSLAMRAAAEQRETVGGSGTYGGDVSPALAREGAGATVLVYEGDKTKEWTFRTGGAGGR